VVIIDTNLWVSYVLVSESPLGRKLHQLIQDQPYAFSDETFIELTDVLMRDKFDHFVSAQKRGAVLRLIASGAEWFRPTEKINDCRDPKDNKFLELAVASQATLLVTGDADLLVLDPFRGIKILKISEADED